MYQKHPVNEGLIALQSSSEIFDQVAVLIDAENTRPDFEMLMQKASQYGQIQEARIYGNRTLIRDINRWRRDISQWNLTAVYTEKGMPNAADMALIIDAMDILHSQPEIGTFIIVSVDSDFIPLIHRLRSAGKKVIGMSSYYPPHMLRTAYHEYHTLIKLEWDDFEFNLHEFYVQYLDSCQFDGWVLWDEILYRIPDGKQFLLRLKRIGYSSVIAFLKDSHWFDIWHNTMLFGKHKQNCFWVKKRYPDLLDKPLEEKLESMRQHASEFYSNHGGKPLNPSIFTLIDHWNH